MRHMKTGPAFKSYNLGIFAQKETISLFVYLFKNLTVSVARLGSDTNGRAFIYHRQGLVSI